MRVSPRVSSAVFHNGNKTYLVAFASSPAHVGAFFQESRLERVESMLPNLTLRVEPTFAFKQARNLMTGELCERTDGGAIRVNLPKTTYVVVEFER
jgi:hypothetical protein